MTKDLELENVKILFGAYSEPKVNRLLVRLGRKWEDNIKVWAMRVLTGFSWLRMGSSVRLM
jgi:hypothetical protein